MKKNIFALCLLGMAAACAQPIEPVKFADYQCGADQVRVKFMNDNSLVIHLKHHKLILNKVSAGVEKRYEDITKHIIFIQSCQGSSLKINHQPQTPCTLCRY